MHHLSPVPVPSAAAPAPASRAAAAWHALTPAQRRLAIFAAIAFMSGLFHVAVWLAHGAPSLVGPVTWRKPIVFGFSTGVVTASLAWVVGMLRDGRGLARSSWAYIVFLTLELSLIYMQQWRGVGSHFNEDTRFDWLVFQAMGLFILAAAAIVAMWTWQLFRSGSAAGRPERLLAARVGLLLLNAGSLLGVALAVWGSAVVRQTGTPPASVGAFGSIRLAHAIALHGLQVLPIVAIVLGRLVSDRARVLSLMRLAAAGYVGLLILTVSGAFARSMPAAPLLGALAFVSCLALTRDRPSTPRRGRASRPTSVSPVVRS